VDLLKRVKDFIGERLRGQSPLLLGYSGGPDSKALLYALIEMGGVPLHLAHIDHAWRPESGEEARLLAAEAKQLNLPFHSLRLSEKPTRNLEEAGRFARLSFFRSLFDKIPFAALLLAHQADDRAETALKRLCEGAHLAHLGGLAPVSVLEGMPVWRPLLAVRKTEIHEFLAARRLQPLLDPTNEDPRFLRTRLRSQTMPQLRESFGKEIVENLALLSERAIELRDYLDQKIAPVWQERREGPEGIAVSLQGLERVEARHLLQKLGSSQGLCIPRRLLEPMLDAAKAGGRARRFQVGGKTFLMDGGCITLILADCKLFKISKM